VANFEEIARAAREKSAGIVDAEERAKQARQEAEDERLQKAFQVLHDNVVPVLEEARDAFLKDGVEMDIAEAESFRTASGIRGGSSKIRIVTFECFSRDDQGQSASKAIKSAKFVFESDGTTIVAKPYGSITGGQTFPGGTFPDFVAPVAAQALASYYDAFRRSRDRRR